MPLSTGTKLGSYEILAPLGAGGMGEVYRARDTKLDREVAIKVMPAALARDPERLARFEREAKVLASLNHPNIAQIYGVEEWGGGRALVMELVPGAPLQTLLALDTTLNYARQIADALEAAHEKGITPAIHAASRR
jgi:serine/threonine protein kinase